MRRLAGATLVAAFVAAFAASASAQGDGDAPVVFAVEIEGIVTAGTAQRVADAVDAAEARGVPLLLLLDTPGGLVDATLDIKQSVFGAGVPVLTFVGPDPGAYAASAGTFILLMGSPSGMAPATQIGSTQPVQIDPSGGGAANATDKVENFVVKQMETIARERGRNATLAVRFVTENLNLDAEEARAAGVVDVVARDVDAFLSAVDGRAAMIGVAGDTVTLRTAGARVDVLSPAPLARLLDLIGNPQVAFVLFLVGVYALIFGLAAPGTFVPETIGALLLVLGLIGLGLFDFNVAAALLIGLAALFFIADLFAPTHGVLTVAGVVSLVLGVLFLPSQEPLLPGGFVRTFRIVGVALALASGGVTVAAIALALRHRRAEPYGELVGATGVVQSEVRAGDAGGQVWVQGALWRAVAGGPIPEGTTVRVVERQGLTLRVEPAADAHR